MVTFAVELSRAAAELARLVQQVETGAEIVITAQGRPVARLVAATQPAEDREPGTAVGLFTVPDDFDDPLDEFREYM